MAASIQDLFTHNRTWAAQIERERPGFESLYQSALKSVIAAHR